MKPLDLFLPEGYHYRVRVSSSSYGHDGGVVHIGHFDDPESIAAKVKEAVCGTRAWTYRGFNREQLQEHEKTKHPCRERITPQKLCPKCIDYLRTKHIYQAYLTDDQIKAVIECVLGHMVVVAPNGQRVQIDGAVPIHTGALSDIRIDLRKVLGLDDIARDARVGAIFRRAVERGRKLHPWEGHTHMLAAIESEVAELQEAHELGDDLRKQGEALDVVVTAYRYYEGK